MCNSVPVKYKQTKTTTTICVQCKNHSVAGKACQSILISPQIQAPMSTVNHKLPKNAHPVMMRNKLKDRIGRQALCKSAFLSPKKISNGMPSQISPSSFNNEYEVCGRCSPAIGTCPSQQKQKVSTFSF